MDVVKARARLDWVQVGRAVAALVVVASHIPPFDHSEVNRAANFGSMGVEFFFLLSGFIIYHAHQKDLGRPERLGRFAFKRAIRIFPTYWAALVGVLLITFTLVSAAYRPDVGDGFLVRETLLLPGHEPFIGPAWTLRHELLFYGVFAIAIVNRAAGVAVFTAWMAAAAVVTVSSPPDMTQTIGWDIVFHHYNLDFAIGIGAAALGSVARKKLVVISVVAAAGFLVACSLTSGDAASWCQIIGYKFTFLTALLGAVLMSTAGIPAPRFAVFLGAASYAIYLLNRDVGFTMGRAFRKVGLPVDQSWLGFIVTLAVATVAGIALHWFFERRVTNWLAGRAARNSSQPGRAVV